MSHLSLYSLLPFLLCKISMFMDRRPKRYLGSGTGSERGNADCKINQIPDELIPEDGKVEIDAKVHAGYFTTGKVMNIAELSDVHGRAWEDVDH